MKLLIALLIALPIICIGGEAKLRYNPMTKQWSYEPSDAKVKYNPMNRKWEWATPDAKIK